MISQKSGHEYDGRRKLEVVTDLRKAGKKASMYVPPENLFCARGDTLGFALKGKDGKDLLSLGGTSGVVNVVCNEGGSFFHYPPRFFVPEAPAVRAASERKKEMLNLAKKVGVKTIDLEPAFAGYENPSDLTHAASTHYSEAGYALAAATIAKVIGLKNP